MSTTPACLPKEYSTGYFIEMVTHPDINPVQQGLTSVNRREPVFSLLVIAVSRVMDAFGKLLREKLEKLSSHLRQYVHRNLPCASLTQQTHPNHKPIIIIVKLTLILRAHLHPRVIAVCYFESLLSKHVI